MDSAHDHISIPTDQRRKHKLYQRLNEVHIIEHDEFMQMAPTITQLEIARLTDLLTGLEPGSDLYTTLVSARYHLSRFMEDLEHGSKPSHEHLDAAILSLVIPENENDETIKDTIAYVGDRLGYILAQMKRLR